MWTAVHKSYLVYVMLLRTTLFFAGCGGNDGKTWSSFKPLNDIGSHIDAYYSASLSDGANPKSGNPAIYIDFSDGLIQAYTKNPVNKDIIQAITNKLVSPEIEWYAMDSGQIKKLQLSSNQVFNKVSTPA